MPSLLPLAIGVVAILVTAAFIALQAILAAFTTGAAIVRTTAVAAIATESCVTLGLTLFCLGYAFDALGAHARRHMNLAMCAGIVGATAAAVVSIIALVLLSKNTADLESDTMSIPPTTMLISSAVLIGSGYPLQLLFLVVQFINGRKAAAVADSNIFGRVKDQSSKSKLKSIPYNQTNTSIEKRQDNSSLDAPSIAPSTGGRKSGVETSGSVSSRTRLLSMRDKRRPASLESMANRSSTEDTFESWDTSSVDAHSKQTILDLSSSPPPPSKPRFLETIPASPTGSRSPSPGSSLELPLPPRRAQRRSRSYSPASSRRDSISSVPNSTNESHIHPLFRSDSTEPPPVATPGTSVVASPIAGQVISPRPSIRSLNRMRSGSLPTAPSPLSRQSSFEDGVARRLADEQSSIQEEKEDEKEDDDDGSVRKMTPPIPDWIMSAGNRSSLTGYRRRTLKEGESKAASPSSTAS